MSRARVLLVGLLAPLFLTAAASARIQFTQGDPFLMSVRPTDFAVGEFDRDGIPDLVAIGRGSREINVLFGQQCVRPTETGCGTWKRARVERILRTNLLEPVVADFNQDTLDDIAVLDRAGARSKVWFLINEGDGEFRDPFSFEITQPPGGLSRNAFDMVTADFDNDGDPDLAITDVTTDRLFILINQGGDPPEFLRNTADGIIVGQTPWFLTAGDYDLDGDIDLAFIERGFKVVKNIKIFRNDGVIPPNPFLVFEEATVIGSEDDPWGMIDADLNNDGVLDLLMLNSPRRDRFGAGQRFTSDINFLFGTGNNLFNGPQIFDIGCPFNAGEVRCGPRKGFNNLQAADFDDDGVLDLIVSIIDTRESAVNDFLSIFRGTPDGRYVLTGDLNVRRSPDVLAIADFTGDGKPDVAVGSRGESTVQILVNISTPPRGNGEPCVENDECGSAFCEGGICCEERCDVGESCGVIDREGICTPLLPPGAGCIDCSECVTFSCIDGVCCDQFCPDGMCCGACAADRPGRQCGVEMCTDEGDFCDIPDSRGICEEPNGPGEPCARPGHCRDDLFCADREDGIGVCCFDPNCPDGERCGPDGRCAPLPTPTPTPIRIGGRCERDSDCAPGLFCTDGVCCEESECPSGFFCKPADGTGQDIGQCVSGPSPTPEPTRIPSATPTGRGAPPITRIVDRGGGCNVDGMGNGGGAGGLLLLALPILIALRRSRVLEPSNDRS